MKKHFFIAFIALSIISTSVSAQFVKADLQVSGLTCSMCQLATEKALRTLDFVGDVRPDLNTNIYTLTFKKDKAVNFDMIRKKVKDAGFSVSKLVATVNFNNAKLDGNSQLSYLGKKFYFIGTASKTLNGPTRITVVDKGFVPDGTYKKYSATIKAPGYKTGMVGNTRIYHVTI